MVTATEALEVTVKSIQDAKIECQNKGIYLDYLRKKTIENLISIVLPEVINKLETFILATAKRSERTLYYQLDQENWQGEWISIKLAKEFRDRGFEVTTNTFNVAHYDDYGKAYKDTIYSLEIKW